jgi:hypothetical protein
VRRAPRPSDVHATVAEVATVSPQVVATVIGVEVFHFLLGIGLDRLVSSRLRAGMQARAAGLGVTTND